MQKEIIELVQAFRAVTGVHYATISANVATPGVYLTLAAVDDDQAAALGSSLGAPALTRTERDGKAWMATSCGFGDGTEIRIYGPHRDVEPEAE